MNRDQECSIRRILLYIVETTPPIHLANWIKPHLTKVKNDALTRFYRFLTTQPSSAIFAIEDVVMNCYSNEHLFHLIQKLSTTML